MKYDDDDLDPPEREVTLGTAAILGIFLVLALVCGAFFGFGYSMGRRSAPQQAAAEPKPDSKSADFSDFKSAPDSDSTSDTATDTPKPATPAPAPPAEKTAPAPKQDEPQVVVHQPAPAAKPADAPHAVAFPVPAPAVAQPAAAAPGTPQIMVQISATSRQGDAEALIAALKQKGYAAAIHHQPDNLYHVQLGPFASKKEADDLRKRLGTDGYNAILK